MIGLYCSANVTKTLSIYQWLFTKSSSDLRLFRNGRVVKGTCSVTRAVERSSATRMLNIQYMYSLQCDLNVSDPVSFTCT